VSLLDCNPVSLLACQPTGLEFDPRIEHLWVHHPGKCAQESREEVVGGCIAEYLRV
jgi:hypothetical protein